MRTLYRQHVGRVHRHVARILGRHDPDVEDVVQKVFVAALQGASHFDGRSAVSTWILGIATRRALDEARNRWRRGRFSRLAERVGMGRPSARPDTQHSAVAEAEAALAHLKPAQRTVFVLHDVEGHTLEEIREMTGTAISTLHARLQKARGVLKRIVERDGQGGTP
jgi:RNA polymerase sigma-70 factor, ECF subfamily